MALVGRCQFCRAPLQVTLEGGKWKQLSPCACDRPAGAAPPPPVPALPRTVAEKVAVRQFSRHGTAERTDCSCGRSHSSKGEARVCQELRARYPRVLQQVRFPLLNLGGGDRGGASYLTVDFVVFPEGGEWEAVDAKSPGAPRSRDWRRGVEAFLGCWGKRVREVWMTASGKWQEAGR